MNEKTAIANIAIRDILQHCVTLRERWLNKDNELPNHEFALLMELWLKIERAKPVGGYIVEGTTGYPKQEMKVTEDNTVVWPGIGGKTKKRHD